MAGELVKYDGGKLIKPSSALQRYREARASALALLHETVPALNPPQPSVRRSFGESGGSCVVCGPYPGLVVDLPRKCAVHGGPYAARYVFGDDRRFRLGSMIAVTEALYLRQYAGNGCRVPVPSSDNGEETCPLCGAAGFGSVLCPKCGREVCYGRTAGRYFRCHPSCGGHGVMEPKARNEHGVSPVDMRWR